VVPSHFSTGRWPIVSVLKQNMAPTQGRTVQYLRVHETARDKLNLSHTSYRDALAKPYRREIRLTGVGISFSIYRKAKKKENGHLKREAIPFHRGSYYDD